jgi:hypothetical protein
MVDDPEVLAQMVPGLEEENARLRAEVARLTAEPPTTDEVLRRLVAEGELEHYAVDYYGRPIYRRLSAEAGDTDG